MPGKVCSRCGEWKIDDKFANNRRSADGRASACRDCINAQRRAKNYMPDPSLAMKTCTACGDTKPIDAFGLHKSGKDGYDSRCRDCKASRARDLDYPPDPAVTHKRCGPCGEIKPVSEFYLNKRLKDGYATYCKGCRREQERYRKYNLLPGWYDEQFLRQGGLCAICDRSDRQLYVDHDHGCCPYGWSCGICVRGLICDSCNVGLGNFRDNPDILTRAVEYLSEHEPWRGGA